MDLCAPVGYIPIPGPPGPPGDAAAVYNESPSGLQDGVNTVFTLANTPQSSSTAVYRNGLREYLGVGYVESGADIVFTTPPLADDVLTADYLIGS